MATPSPPVRAIAESGKRCTRAGCGNELHPNDGVMAFVRTGCGRWVRGGRTPARRATADPLGWHPRRRAEDGAFRHDDVGAAQVQAASPDLRFVAFDSQSGVSVEGHRGSTGNDIPS